MSHVILCDHCKASTWAPLLIGWFTLTEQHEEGTHLYHYCSTDCLAADWRPVT